MLLERGPCLPRLIFYGIGVICLCVMMYMLGSTMTLWTLQFALDQTDNPVLEGFSLPTALSGGHQPSEAQRSQHEQCTPHIPLSGLPGASRISSGTDRWITTGAPWQTTSHAIASRNKTCCCPNSIAPTARCLTTGSSSIAA